MGERHFIRLVYRVAFNRDRGDGIMDGFNLDSIETFFAIAFTIIVFFAGWASVGGDDE